MAIRKFRKSDSKQVKSLVTDVLMEIFGSANNLSDLDNIGGEYELFLVAEENGKIIGTLGIKNEGDARISRMYVKKSERDKGIGKALMAKALEYCKGKFKRAFLSTYAKMNSANFYKKCGFKEYKEDERIWMEMVLN